MSESGSGEVIGWTVEARHVCDGPKMVGRQNFDGKWRQVVFTPNESGVPIDTNFGGMRLYETWYKLTGRFSYEAAQALRWWFLTHAGTLCMETRLVRYKITYQYNVEPDGAGHITNEENTRWVRREDLPPADAPEET